MPSARATAPPRNLHALYATLAQSTAYGRYTDARLSVLAGGRWTATLPCLATEPYREAVT